MGFYTTWDELGIWFCLDGSDQPFLPLENLETAMRNDWEALCGAEQLWYDESLTYDPHRHAYLLSMADFAALPRAEKRLFALPEAPTQLVLTESGNLGSARYAIRWSPMVNGTPAGKTVRTGAILTYGDRQTVLSPAQYALLEVIDQYEDVRRIAYRARFCASVSMLAQKAGTTLRRSNPNHIFYGLSQVAARPVSAPGGVRITPYFPELPQALQEWFAPGCPTSLQRSYQGKQITVFLSPEAKSRYEAVAALPILDEQAYQSFSKTPERFLPSGVTWPNPTPPPREVPQGTLSMQDVPIAMDPSTRKAYQHMRTAPDAAEQLRKLCSHPALCTDALGDQTGKSLLFASPKLAWTVRTLDSLLAAGGTALVFTPYPRMRAILRLVLKTECRVEAHILRGLPTARKEALLRAFAEQPSGGVLIADPESAGWIHVPALSALIFYTPESDARRERQALACASQQTRIYRPFLTMPEGTTVEAPI